MSARFESSFVRLVTLSEVLQPDQLHDFPEHINITRFFVQVVTSEVVSRWLSGPCPLVCMWCLFLSCYPW